MWKYRSRYAPILAAILATACGGGGGGDGGSVAPPPPAEPPLAQISLTNQDTVARASLTSVVAISGVSSSRDTPNAAAERGTLMRLTMKALNSGNASASSNIARPLAVIPSTAPCLLGGTASLSLDDKDDSGSLTAGDSLTAVFVQCRDSAESSIDGTMTLSFSSVSPSGLDVAGSITYQQLVMIDQAASLSLDGVVSFSFNETYLANGVKDLGSFTVANTGLTVTTTGGAGGFADTFTYRVGYNVTEEDFMPNAAGAFGTSVITASGKFQSHLLGGDLSLATPQAFRLTAPDDNPGEGQLMVSGKSNTKLGVTAVSNAQVRIDVCDDGDNVWEGTKTIDWSAVM